MVVIKKKSCDVINNRVHDSSFKTLNNVWHISVHLQWLLHRHTFIIQFSFLLLPDPFWAIPILLLTAILIHRFSIYWCLRCTIWIH